VRPPELLATEARQLESLLKVLRPGSADRPSVLERLLADYEELARVAPTEQARAAARAGSDRCRQLRRDACKADVAQSDESIDSRRR
jgi:hypothetical protein